MMLHGITSSSSDSLGRFRIDIRKKIATGRVMQDQNRLLMEAVRFVSSEVFIPSGKNHS